MCGGIVSIDMIRLHATDTGCSLKFQMLLSERWTEKYCANSDLGATYDDDEKKSIVMSHEFEIKSVARGSF